MADNSLLIRYEGKDADQHKLDMRQLGESLVGIERLINAGLYSIEHGERPGHGLKLDSVVSVSKLQPGSVELIPLLQIAAYSILSDPYIQNHIGTILHKFIKIPILAFSGFGSSAKRESERVWEIFSNVEDHRHQELMRSYDLQEKAYNLIAHRWSYNAARNAVSPIGRGCECMSISDREASDTITPEMANSIRSKVPLDEGDIKPMTLRIDGFTGSTRRLDVIRPGSPSRAMKAIVRDPIFDTMPNFYTEAAISKSQLKLYARELRRGNRVVELEIFGEYDESTMRCERCGTENGGI